MNSTAVLGTGLMGAPMALRMLESGFKVNVWNRSRDKAEPLAAGGAVVCDTPAEAVTDAEVVVLMLSDVKAIVTVLFDESVQPLLSGRTVIQMGTIEPAESRALAEELANLGARYLEAPVLGSIPEAKKGRLQIMAGGDPEVFTECMSLLRAFSDDPVLVGETGQGAALKLAMNQLIASLTSGFALSLGLVRREGVSVELFMDLLRDSALYAPTFDKKLDRMLQRDFEHPNFPLKHMEKDVKLFLKAASEHPLGLAGLKGVDQLLERGILDGLSELDYSAIYNVIDREKK